MPCISMGSEIPVLPVNALSIKLDGITPFISPMLSESLRARSTQKSSLRTVSRKHRYGNVHYRIHGISVNSRDAPFLTDRSSPSDTPPAGPRSGTPQLAGVTTFVLTARWL